MQDIKLMPVNLAEFNVPRVTMDGTADLVTIAKTPYPVLSKYKKLCAYMDVEPFAGGTWKKQGKQNVLGYITSGYRNKVIEGNISSPHLFAFALDIAVGDIKAQVEWAKRAIQLYTRIGLYPANGFIHVDLAPIIWMKKYYKRRYWCKVNGVYKSFMKFNGMIDYATSSQEGKDV
jgi:hypothetical protein